MQFSNAGDSERQACSGTREKVDSERSNIAGHYKTGKNMDIWLDIAIQHSIRRYWRARERSCGTRRREFDRQLQLQIKKKIKIENSRKRNSFPLLSIVKRSHLFFGPLYHLPQIWYIWVQRHYPPPPFYPTLTSIYIAGAGRWKDTFPAEKPTFRADKPTFQTKKTTFQLKRYLFSLQRPYFLLGFRI